VNNWLLGLKEWLPFTISTVTALSALLAWTQRNRPIVKGWILKHPLSASIIYSSLLSVALSSSILTVYIRYYSRNTVVPETIVHTNLEIKNSPSDEPSRVLTVSYPNSIGRPRIVMVSAHWTKASSSLCANISKDSTLPTRCPVGGVTPDSKQIAYSSFPGTDMSTSLTFIVPFNFWYNVTSDVPDNNGIIITNWAEADF
jgi:hypothetical protein